MVRCMYSGAGKQRSEHKMGRQARLRDEKVATEKHVASHEKPRKGALELCVIMRDHE